MVNVCEYFAIMLVYSPMKPRGLSRLAPKSMHLMLRIGEELSVCVFHLEFLKPKCKQQVRHIQALPNILNKV